MMMNASRGSRGCWANTSAATFGSRSRPAPLSTEASRSPYSTRLRSAIREVGMRPPARPAISIAKASECPVPKAVMTPPLATASASRSAARAMGPSWALAVRSGRRWVTCSRKRSGVVDTSLFLSG
ncbi:Uncharacterised protein [Mycobacteroides abscessus subsp. abscessus]|nr:Uncharacterised protein [Mycobacteroides abscessus subsp. abscessus]